MSARDFAEISVRNVILGCVIGGMAVYLLALVLV